MFKFNFQNSETQSKEDEGNNKFLFRIMKTNHIIFKS